MSRLEQLLKFVAEDPKDPFNIYAVALEYLKLGDDKAYSYLESLIQDHKDYVPTYYTLGKALIAKQEKLKAKEIFEHGINVAERKQDSKALRELKNALTELEFDLDEL